MTFRICGYLGLLLLVAGCQRHSDLSSSAPGSNATASAVAPAGTEAGTADEKAVLSELTQAVRRFGMEQQRRPRDLDELVAKGYLPSVPAAPAGRKFVIDRNLSVILANQ